MSDSAASGVFSTVGGRGYGQFCCSSSGAPVTEISGQSGFSCTNESATVASPMQESSSSSTNHGQAEAALTEHDYIGLSESAFSFGVGAGVGDNGVPDLNLGETELRLGLPATCAHHSPCTGDAILYRACEMVDMDEARPHMGVSGAKRGFSEAITTGFLEESSFVANTHSQIAPFDYSGVDLENKHPRTRLMPPLYPWGAVDVDQLRVPFPPVPSAVSSKVQPKAGALIAMKDCSAKLWHTHDKITADSSYSAELVTALRYSQKNHLQMPGNGRENTPSPSAPVVGWPPVQSFRNKALAAHPQPKSSNVSRVLPPAVPSALAPSKNALDGSRFVKVYMDGVSIGRKVDLKNSNSYEKLSVVLEDMFGCFILGSGRSEKSLSGKRALPKETNEQSFFHGSEYVLTYDDKDGDLMLVGDVPWSMFIGTVKRLRIMKGSNAIGLAPKSIEKDNFKVH